MNKRTVPETVFMVFNLVFLFLLCLTFLYPIINSLAKSLSRNEMVMTGTVYLWPKGFTLASYSAIFKDSMLWTSFRNTLIVVVAGTSLRMLVILLAAFGLSKPDLRGRKIIFGLFIFTMYFSGGMIPSFLLIRYLGIYDTLFALILPGTVIPFYLILAKNYFEQINPNLEESAMVDGANYFTIFIRIILPVSKPILGVLFIFTIVGLWNLFMPAVLYTVSSKYSVLQLYVRQMVLEGLNDNTIIGLIDEEMLTFGTQSKKMAILSVTSIPILLIYPFFQKYFVKGVMIGSVKE